MITEFFTPATPFESRMIDIGELSLNVNRYGGNGPEVLLVHGTGASSREFAQVIDDLAEVMQPITVDLRGHGDSDKPDTAYHYDEYERDLERLLAVLELDRPIILGHSLGGIVTLRWAMRHPNAARALIIEDSPLRSEEGIRPVLEGWAALNAMPFEGIRAHYASEYPRWPDHMVNTVAWGMHVMNAGVISGLIEEAEAHEGLDAAVGMERITAPVLFIHGDPETGSMVHPDDLAALPGRLPTARLAHIPGGAHSMHRNHIPEWLEIVKGFIREIE